jgi:hypothetical protein
LSGPGALYAVQSRVQPGIGYSFEVYQQLAVVQQGVRLVGQYVPGCEEGLLMAYVSFFIGEQVFYVEVIPVSQFCNGITEYFQDGDAGIMGVVISPPAMRQRFYILQAFTPQEVIVCCRRQLPVFCDI